MIWIALVAFSTTDACDAFVAEQRLMETIMDVQCVLIEPDEPIKPLAPETSLRPKARPTNLGVSK